MDGVLRQAERLGRLTTALGEDVLVLLRFEGSDFLNELFEYRVEALATQDDLDFDALIGTHATVEIEAHEVMRPFDGVVTSAQYSGVGENGHIYTLTLRPWFWLAGRRRNYRIFHRKTVDQILRELLSDYAVFSNPHLEIKLSNQYEELEYTVQHGTSDLEFARRQMERHGISFHFRHDKGSHTLVLTDDELAHDEIGEIPFKRFDGHHSYDREHFWDWKPERNFTTGAVLQTDYNFKHPTQKMDTSQASDAQYAFGHVESFDYPGDYLSESPGKIVTRMRQRQERGADRRNRAVGDCVSLASGQRVKLGGDKVPGHGETYLCLSATHRFVSESYGSGGEGSDGYSYSGSWVLMPDTAPMVPPRRTPLAVVHGPQTAMVVGDGEIDCDEFGRILVQFHWDLDKNYSMRCRVSQNWAGNGWGGMVIPRIGMEVVVEFLEGDPDKPLVTGCIYNGKNKVPYELPTNKTVSTFKSDTHQGRGYNELRFEDESGREEIFVHAEKDRNEKIKHNHTERIDRNLVQSIGRHKLVEVDGNHGESIHGNMSIHVGPSGNGRVLTSAQRADDQGIGSVAYDLPTLGISDIGRGIFSLFADSMISETTPGIKTQFFGVSKTTTVGVSIVQAAGTSVDITSGSRISLDSGDATNISAGKELRILIGQSSLYMNSDGYVRLTGDTLHLDFTNGVQIDGGEQIVAKAKKIDLN